MQSQFITCIYVCVYIYVYESRHYFRQTAWLRWFPLCAYVQTYCPCTYIHLYITSQVKVRIYSAYRQTKQRHFVHQILFTLCPYCPVAVISLFILCHNRCSCCMQHICAYVRIAMKYLCVGRCMCPFHPCRVLYSHLSSYFSGFALFAHSFVRSLVRSFIYLFVCLFTCLFVVFIAVVNCWLTVVILIVVWRWLLNTYTWAVVVFAADIFCYCFCNCYFFCSSSTLMSVLILYLPAFYFFANALLCIHAPALVCRAHSSHI